MNVGKWESMKDKFKDKPKEWWWNTHGIDLLNKEQYYETV